MNKITLILVLLFCGSTIAKGANDNVHREPQSQIVPVSKDDTLRLQMLDKLIEQSANDSNVYIDRIGDLLQEAERQNNKRYIAKAYLRYLFQSYNKHDNEQITQWMGKLEPLARKEGFYDFLFEAQQCVIDMLILGQEFELAEQKSTQMLAEAQKLNHTDGIVIAYKCLASAYRSTYRFEESAEMLETAYKLAPKMKNTQGKLELITYLAAIYRYMEDYPRWLKYLNEKETVIKQQIALEPDLTEFYKGDLMQTYLSYLEYYVGTDQKEKAIYYKQLADKYVCNEYAVYQFNYAKGMASYYQYLGQLDKALEYIDKQCEVLKPLSYRDYPYALVGKASLLYEMGQEQDALNTIKEALRVKDSVQVSIFTKQIELLKANYISSREELQQAHIQRYFQYSILVVVLVLILIFGYFAYKLNYIKKHLIQSKREIRQVAEDVRRATRVKERFLSNMSYAIQIPLKRVVSCSLLLASRNKLGEAERKTATQTIFDTSAHLMNLVEEILDLSRLEAGQMKFTVCDVDAVTAILDAIGASSVPNIKVVSTIPESEKIVVRIDGKRLMQVLNYLLSKAEEGKQICVELGEIPDNTLSVRISHTDFASSNPDQDIIIRNEINRMLIEHFGGSYKVMPGIVHFTLKIQFDSTNSSDK